MARRVASGWRGWRPPRGCTWRAAPRSSRCGCAVAEPDSPSARLRGGPLRRRRGPGWRCDGTVDAFARGVARGREASRRWSASRTSGRAWRATWRASRPRHAPWRLGGRPASSGATTVPGASFAGRVSARRRRPRQDHAHGRVLRDAPETRQGARRRVHFTRSWRCARLHALSDATTRVRFAPDGAFFNLETSNAAKKVTRLSTAERPARARRGADRPESPLVCFDEVELSDIADALVFKRVFEKVFERGGALSQPATPRRRRCTTAA